MLRAIKKWASAKRWENVSQNKTKIVVAEEIGEETKLFLAKLAKEMKWEN